MSDLYIPVPEQIVKPDGRMTRALQLFLQKLVQGLGASGTGSVTHTGALTDHAVIVGNGADDIQALASLGTSGQVLTSNGAAADPSFQAGSSGTVTHTGTLTANQLVIGNGTADIAVLGSLGTTTTLLHGNAAGAPAFGAVTEGDLSLSNVTTADVTISAHGFAPILPNDATKYLDGSGSYSIPGGGSSGGATISSQTTVLTNTQILGLGTTPVTVVTASGSGKANYVISINTSSNCAAGVYNNPFVLFRYAGDTIDLVPPSSNTLNTTTKRIQNINPSDIGAATTVADNKDIQISASTGVTGGNVANQYAITVLFTTRSVL